MGRTMPDIAALRVRHFQWQPGWCNCGDRSPCDTAVVLDRLAAAEKVISAAIALRGAQIASDPHEPHCECTGCVFDAALDAYKGGLKR